MKVHFSHGSRDLGLYDLEAVPRFGEPVFTGGDDDPPMLVWNVGWRLAPPLVVVALKTEREFNRAAYGRERA